MGNCRTCKSTSLIGFVECSEETTQPYAELSQKAAWLDATVTREAAAPNVLNFANGEKHDVKRAWKNAWMDNIIGAQYLDFPANSRTLVKMRWRAIKTGKNGARLKIMFKQQEKDIAQIPPELPLFFTNDVKEFSFTIDNVEKRADFSFHLLAEAPMVIEMLEFMVTHEPLTAAADTNAGAAIKTENGTAAL